MPAATNQRLVKLNSRIKQAFTQISQVSDRAVGEFSEDVSKMAAQLLRDKIKHPDRSEGKLASSTKSARHGELSYSVVTDAQNDKGYGYGAAIHWGWRRGGGKKKGKRVKGKMFIVRATFGMVKRWQRGERWRD